MKRRFFLLIGLLLLVGSGCERRGIDEAQVRAKIDARFSIALEERDPGRCTDLPSKQPVYWFPPHSTDPEYDIRYPQNECLWKYVEETADVSACNLFTSDSSYGTSSKCHAFIAETYSDPTMCPDGNVVCKALASLDANVCLEMLKIDEADTSKYSRGAGFCVGQVVLRTKDAKTCLLIDGIDFGQQWRIQRNDCLMEAAYFQKGDLEKICDMMVEDEPGYDTKSRCKNGEITQYSAMPIPKRIQEPK